MSFHNEFISPQIEIFFGDKADNTELTSRHCRLKQVHSARVVPASPDNAVEADAHYTKQAGLHLCILTADCMPIMMTDGETIAAVHAGWKGLFKNILTKTVNTCFPNPEKAAAFIGPHIHQKSFEFGQDTLNEYQSYKPLQQCTEAIKESNSDKVYINLKKLAEYELNNLGIHTVHSLNVDTFTSSEHHSYRRDHKNSGRNLSWIHIKK